MQWAVANGCPWSPSVTSVAASAGHINILAFAMGNDSSPNQIMPLAAKAGHLHVLKWARAEFVPWDVDVCTLAAAHGHLNVLQWARENGCPWSASIHRTDDIIVL